MPTKVSCRSTSEPSAAYSASLKSYSDEQTLVEHLLASSCVLVTQKELRTSKQHTLGTAHRTSFLSSRFRTERTSSVLLSPRKSDVDRIPHVCYIKSAVRHSILQHLYSPSRITKDLNKQHTQNISCVYMRPLPFSSTNH